MYNSARELTTGSTERRNPNNDETTRSNRLESIERIPRKYIHTGTGTAPSNRYPAKQALKRAIEKAVKLPSNSEPLPQFIEKADPFLHCSGLAPTTSYSSSPSLGRWGRH